MEDVRRRIEEYVSGPVELTPFTNTYETTAPASDLRSAGVIDETTTNSVRYVFSSSGMELARCDYMVFPASGVGYIKDVYVHKSIRGNGIGTQLRGAAVREILQRADTIYSFPTNDTIKHIAREKHDFHPAENSSLSKWFVRRE